MHSIKDSHTQLEKKRTTVPPPAEMRASAPAGNGVAEGKEACKLCITPTPAGDGVAEGKEERKR
jgi:hypothetical protein